MLPVRTPRFYVDIAEPILESALAEKTPIELPAAVARHAGRALRLRQGDIVTLFNGSGTEYAGPIAFSQDSTTMTPEEKLEPERESPVRITLVQSLVAPEKLDWIVEKAVELGVSQLLLIPAMRSVTRLSGERLEKRVQKCRDIAISAAEQCGRNHLMSVEAAPSIEAAFKNLEAEVRFILAPGASKPAQLPPALKSIALAIGPEGGFDPKEIELAQTLGWKAALLGPRVLRTETAGLAATCWVQSLTGGF